jgi:hypothetical protein
MYGPRLSGLKNRVLLVPFDPVEGKLNLHVTATVPQRNLPQQKTKKGRPKLTL